MKDSKSNQNRSVLRIHLRRRSSKTGRGIWGRLFGRAFADCLAAAALLRLDGVVLPLLGVTV